jgi:hypothetical protein
MQIFRDGGADTPTEYEGPREASGIVSHLRKQAGPPSLLLADAAAVKAFRAFTDDKDTVGECSWPKSAASDHSNCARLSCSLLKTGAASVKATCSDGLSSIL